MASKNINKWFIGLGITVATKIIFHDICSKKNISQIFVFFPSEDNKLDLFIGDM